MIPRFPLAPGYDISRLIKGHWQIAAGHMKAGPLPDHDMIAAMHDFVSAGITAFDVADIYAGAEEIIGHFLKKTDFPVQVHTKYVPDHDLLATLSFRDTEAVIDRSLTRLGVERLDLVQFHWWDLAVPGYVETALHLRELQRAGKIRHIGVTNFDSGSLGPILEAGVKIVSAQVQYSLLDRRPEKTLAALSGAHDFHLFCYGTLAGGFLSEKWLGRAMPETDENRSQTKYRLIIEEAGGWDAMQSLLRSLSVVAREKNASIGDIAIAYVLARPRVAAVIVGARDASYLSALKRAAGISLTPEETARIGAALEGLTDLPGDIYGLERTSERHKGIMKVNLNRAAGRDF
ncbi:MAG: aldo/keto reductase [Proteobacteria bacterium]|nr:aldo/keto reductase [Pseudomonadota bacterium]